MAPHYIVLAIALVALGFMQLLVYLDTSGRETGSRRRSHVPSHPVRPRRLQRMP